MDDDGHRMSWAAVVLSAVASGVFVFVAMTLVNRYLFGEDFSWDGLGTATTVTVVWIGIGAAQRRGWMQHPGEPRNGKRRRDGGR